MRKKIILAVFFLIISLFSFNPKVYSLDCEQISDKGQKVSCLEQKLRDLSQAANTLNSEIDLMDTQISLTTSRIQQTEQQIEITTKEIDILGSRIEGLDTSLNYLSKSLVERITQGYKQRSVSLFTILFDSNSATNLFDHIKYLKTAQDNNQKILVQVQEAKLNFEEQKKLREQKKIELANLENQLNSQKVNLNNQKIQKQKLLADTQNDETTYQRLLAQARAEYAAIQGIIAGAGTETQLRNVSKGEAIASVISGSSCNSSGTHLHFIVQEGGSVNNPFDYLKDVSHTDDSGGDSWTPNASKANWDWPLSPTIYFHQGFGVTACVRSGWCGQIYSSHNGLDVSGSSLSVFAVADGTLYRGSYNVGCILYYTKLVHKDSNISTLYLHTYTQ